MFEGLVTAAVISASPMLVAASDLNRERRWLITRQGVELHEPGSRGRAKTIPLPGWQWAGSRHGCAPSLALGPRGEVLVSSYTQPYVWRVDPASLTASRHEPAPDAANGRDVGFSALVYSANLGVYFALSYDHGSLWRIDRGLRRAQQVPLSEPVRHGCSLAVQPTGRFLRLCVQGPEGAWTINLAPDQRSGYVHARRCAN